MMDIADRIEIILSSSGKIPAQKKMQMIAIKLTSSNRK